MMQKSIKYARKNARHLVLLFIALGVTYVVGSYIIIGKNTDRMFHAASTHATEKSADIKVGIVFGGGVTEDEPLPLLRDRLDTAATLLRTGKVDKIILSGDNRRPEYNEPAVMYRYMTQEKNIPPTHLQQDFAGRSTYETCERAHKIFGVSRAFLVSESTHLPRALYLCQHFGIDAYGIVSDGSSSSGLKVGQRWREVMTRSKAVFNVYFIGENTILGDPIDLGV